jgi:carbohydrate diacid regulator
MLDKIAQKLASSTAELIGIDIIITDEKGMIIGASDPSRRGTLHEPSLEVIRTDKTLFNRNKTYNTYKG